MSCTICRQVAQPIGASLAFIGRQHYQEQLTLLMGQTQRGQGQVVILTGETGIGKSRLVCEVSEGALGTGWRVRQGNSFEPDRALPYAILLDLPAT